MGGVVAEGEDGEREGERGCMGDACESSEYERRGVVAGPDESAWMFAVRAGAAWLVGGRSERSGATRASGAGPEAMGPVGGDPRNLEERGCLVGNGR